MVTAMIGGPVEELRQPENFVWDYMVPTVGLGTYKREVEAFYFQ